MTMFSNTDATWDNEYELSGLGSAPPSDAFTPGQTAFTYPKGITPLRWTTGGGSSDLEDITTGLGSYGAISASGTVRAIYNDVVVGEASPGDAYTLSSSPPAGIEDGSDVTPRGGQIVIEMLTESGGSAQKDPSGSQGRNVRFSPTFGTLDVTILDANGDPVPKAKVDIGNVTASTDAQGKLSVDAGGTVTVKALFDTVEEDITVNENNDASRTWEFHGIVGKVRTPTGGAIANVTVEMYDADGNIISAATTKDDGTYELPIAPVSTDLQVVAGPFDRTFTSGAQGEKTTKNLPLTLDTVGSVELDFTDATSGDPVAGLPAELEGAIFSALSTKSGEAALIDGLGSAGAQKEIDITIGKNDARYKTKVITATLVAGDTVELSEELERDIAVVNT